MNPLSGVRPPPCVSGRTRTLLVFGCNWTEGLDWVAPHYRCVLIAMTPGGNNPLPLSDGGGCAVFPRCTSGAFFSPSSLYSLFFPPVKASYSPIMVKRLSASGRFHAVFFWTYADDNSLSTLSPTHTFSFFHFLRLSILPLCELEGAVNEWVEGGWLRSGEEPLDRVFGGRTNELIHSKKVSFCGLLN